MDPGAGPSDDLTLAAPFIRRESGIPSTASEPPSDSLPDSTVPRTFPQDSDGQHTPDLDVTMAGSTVTLGNTMYINDLAGGAVTLPPFAASVSLLTEIDKTIVEELKTLYGIIADPDQSSTNPTSHPIACRDA